MILTEKKKQSHESSGVYCEIYVQNYIVSEAIYIEGAEDLSLQTTHLINQSAVATNQILIEYKNILQLSEESCIEGYDIQ